MLNTKVKIGLILIIAGIILAAAGAAVIEEEPSSTYVSHYSKDLYISHEFNFTSKDALLIVSSDNTSGLMPYSSFKSNYTELNSTNIGKYSVNPTKSIDGEPYYSNLAGKYIYVSVSSSKPSMNYNFATASEFSDVTNASYVAAGGAALLGAGIILAMVTVLLKKLNSGK
ncbi:MAG: hypothetical protein QXZ44_02075 [Ferroplasma sp.]